MLSLVLASRDARAANEKRLLRDYPGRTLLVMTVILPGRVKRDARSAVIARAADEAIAQAFRERIKYRERRDRLTGRESYYIIEGDDNTVKRVAIDIEDSHPLGRLFDIDIIGRDGNPLSRTVLGHAPRRCLLCENEARYCMRARSHSSEALQKKITELVLAYRS